MAPPVLSKVVPCVLSTSVPVAWRFSTFAAMTTPLVASRSSVNWSPALSEALTLINALTVMESLAVSVSDDDVAPTCVPRSTSIWFDTTMVPELACPLAVVTVTAPPFVASTASMAEI